jgi:hypothetical protein
MLLSLNDFDLPTQLVQREHLNRCVESTYHIAKPFQVFLILPDLMQSFLLTLMVVLLINGILIGCTVFGEKVEDARPLIALGVLVLVLTFGSIFYEMYHRQSTYLPHGLRPRTRKQHEILADSTNLLAKFEDEPKMKFWYHAKWFGPTKPREAGTREKSKWLTAVHLINQDLLKTTDGTLHFTGPSDEEAHMFFAKYEHELSGSAKFRLKAKSRGGLRPMSEVTDISPRPDYDPTASHLAGDEDLHSFLSRLGVRDRAENVRLNTAASLERTAKTGDVGIEWTSPHARTGDLNATGSTESGSNTKAGIPIDVGTVGMPHHDPFVQMEMMYKSGNFQSFEHSLKDNAMTPRKVQSASNTYGSPRKLMPFRQSARDASSAASGPDAMRSWVDAQSETSSLENISLASAPAHARRVVSPGARSNNYMFTETKEGEASAFTLDHDVSQIFKNAFEEAHDD